MLDVPHLRQLRSWSCGPACVRMVLRYFGEDVSEGGLVDECGATGVFGTDPKNLARVLRARGYGARVANLLAISDLAHTTGLGRPVILTYQAWPQSRVPVDLSQSWDHGHYAVCVGVERGRVILADPSSKRPRISFTESEFVSRWRDLSPDATRRYLQWGLSVGPKR